MKNRAFTLAETLITLMIIGVVAALTIPTLMNVLGENQLKTSYKKAMSVLSQGVQLMKAKEIECTVKDNATLAECFNKNILSGSLVDYEGGADGYKNVVLTPDGMAFAFVFKGDRTANKERTLEEICGKAEELFAEENAGILTDDYDGGNAKCAVIVDLNGFTKGSKRFVGGCDTGSCDGCDWGTLPSGGCYASEEFPIYITGNAVKPFYADWKEDWQKDWPVSINRGYAWIYGENASPVQEN